jgi:hypothetical protein
MSNCKKLLNESYASLRSSRIAHCFIKWRKISRPSNLTYAWNFGVFATLLYYYK